ncbi:hypothetical protein HOO65_070567 [Ceratocystis lukuohia]|uniref:DDE-1 domain-containing protein n=1 Tax=Ceratocystis lukuohia TaxID=2019550 RepID=A0ABR4MCV3_9PEZI
MAKYDGRLYDFYNIDETGFMMGIVQSGMVFTGIDRRGKPKLVQRGKREWITAIQAVGADAWANIPFIIGVGQYRLANWYRESNFLGDGGIATTQNWWTDNKTGLRWLQHFDRYTARRRNSRRHLLILDGHESHHSTSFASSTLS